MVDAGRRVASRPLAAEDPRLLRQRLSKWAKENGRPFPWRGTRDPFEVLVAELLLQRSRSSTVSKVYIEVLAQWPTARAMAQADADAIAGVIRPLGLTSRAVTLQKVARAVDKHGMPTTVEGLRSLPGVGRYVANATAAAAFGAHAPVVDGVSARVYRRVYGFTQPGDEPDVWELAAKVAPTGDTTRWNWAVLDLASSVCLPKRPRCWACPVADACVTGREASVAGTT